MPVAAPEPVAMEEVSLQSAVPSDLQGEEDPLNASVQSYSPSASAREEPWSLHAAPYVNPGVHMQNLDAAEADADDAHMRRTPSLARQASKSTA